MNKNTSLVAKNTLIILTLFTQYESLTVREIVTHTGLNISTVYRLVNTLEEQKYIILTSSNQYVLNTGIVLQLYKMVNKDLKEYVGPIMKDLVVELQESVYLSKLNEDRRVMVVEKEDGPGKLQWMEDIGYLYDIPIGTAGKAHLAFLLKNSSDQEKIKLINQLNLKKFTDKSVIDKKSLMDDVKKILIEGYSLTKGEHIEGMIGISVPVFSSRKNYTGYILTVMIPSIRYDESKKYDYIFKMKNTALEIGEHIN